MQWHPEFVDDVLPANDVEVPASSARWPLVAHGMTGTISFDGTTVTIHIEDHAVDRSADRTIRLPLAEIGSLEWVPATTTHRGSLRIAPPPAAPPSDGTYHFAQYTLIAPPDDGAAVAFKLRQQGAFEAIRDALERHLSRRPA